MIETATRPANEQGLTNLMTMRQVAEWAGVCEKTIWTMTKAKTIPCIRFGRSVRYCPRMLEGFIESFASRSMAG